MSLWDQHNVTDLIRQILRAVPIEPQYNTGRAYLTTYQIAIALNALFPQVAVALGQATGGAGQGPYALTTYIARWLPDRILNRGVNDIEMAFLAPDNLDALQFSEQNATLVATTNAAGFNSTMFRAIVPIETPCQRPMKILKYTDAKGGTASICSGIFIGYSNCRDYAFLAALRKRARAQT